MRKSRIVLMGIAAAVALVLAPAPGGAAPDQTWSNVALIDGHCAGKAAIKADPDAHTRDCLLMCEKGGYGIFTAEGEHVKFDAAGSQKAKELLQASKKADHIRVDVVGVREGDVIKVTSISPAA